MNSPRLLCMSQGDSQKLLCQVHVQVPLKPLFNCLGFMKDLVTKLCCAITYPSLRRGNRRSDRLKLYVLWARDSICSFPPRIFMALHGVVWWRYSTAGRAQSLQADRAGLEHKFPALAITRRVTLEMFFHHICA